MINAALLDDTPPPRRWHMDPRDKDPRDETARCQAALRKARMICPAVDIVAIPNAGRRTRWEQRQRKKEGMVAGALDWVVTWKPAPWHPTTGCDRGVAFVEWKGAQDYPDANQRDRLDRLFAWGFRCAVVRQEDSFFRLLKSWGAPFILREGVL